MIYLSAEDVESQTSRGTHERVEAGSPGEFVPSTKGLVFRIRNHTTSIAADD